MSFHLVLDRIRTALEGQHGRADDVVLQRRDVAELLRDWQRLDHAVRAAHNAGKADLSTDDLMSPTEAIRQQLLELPAPGKPVNELTDRDKLALAWAAGVPCEMEQDGGKLTMRSLVPFGIADKGDGTYIIAQLLRRNS